VRCTDVLRVFPATALLLALVLVVVLAHQNRSLRAELTRVRLQAHLPPVGLTVPAFDAVTLSGESVTVGRAANAQVLFFFATTCDFCRRTLPAWDTIAAHARQATPGFTVFGLSQDRRRGRLGVRHPGSVGLGTDGHV
jgi:hypothetical protein